MEFAIRSFRGLHFRNRWLLFILWLLPVASLSQTTEQFSASESFTKTELNFFAKMSSATTIIRDTWGVPHIYATTDQQCSFGLMYAQCEDNFWQVEETMIDMLGRMAEVYGESGLANDIQVALFECIAKAKNSYKKADPAIQQLCDGAAAGLNYYIYLNPSKKRLLNRYEPWYFLIPSPVSPGGHGITNSERETIRGQLLNTATSAMQQSGIPKSELSGSNTLALSARKLTDGKSALVINPHVSFFGSDQRYEAHLISKQGLNVSGFAILGTCYIWSGFTENTAWAHTNTGADNLDVYLEIVNKNDTTQYLYEKNYRKIISWRDTIVCKTTKGLEEKVYTFRKTHHGPVVAKRDSMLVTIRSAQDNNQAGYILQSLLMCKAKDLKKFKSAISLCQLATNTMYADRLGNIAYWHGSRVPVRDSNFDWKLPVDGSISKTEWKGFHKADQLIHFINPPQGYLQNCNSDPNLAAGIPSVASGLRRSYYLAYDRQNFRSEEMLRQLSAKEKFQAADIPSIIFSKNLPVMQHWLPDIINDYKREVLLHPELKDQLGAVIDTLSRWDHKYSLTSKATTLAFAWHTEYLLWAGKKTRGPDAPAESFPYYNGPKLLTPPGIATSLLLTSVKDLTGLYGTPFVPWSEICRLQRIHTNGREKFDDNKHSIPVNAAPGIMGSLFSFNLRFEQTGKRGYGVSGNTYTALVTFGKKMKALSVVTFGQDSDPQSPHYFDQASLYADNKFKEAWYYKPDVLNNAKETYHPGERRTRPSAE